MEESERLYCNLRTEWRASRGNVVTVAASTSAQKRRDKSLATEKMGVAGELAVVIRASPIDRSDQINPK